MKIGFLLPSVLTTPAYNNRIFAPRELFTLLADGLVDRGHEVYAYTSSNLKTKAVIVPGNEELEKLHLHSVKDVSKKPEAIPEISENRKSIEYALELDTRTFRHIKEHNVQILHVYADFIAYYFAGLTTVPLVYTLHDPVFPEDTFEYWRLNYFASQPHITISNSQKKQYQNQMKLNSVATIYHGIKLDNFDFLDSPSKDLLFIGRFLAQKGISDALKASVTLDKPLRIASSGNYQQTEFYKNEILPYVMKYSSLIKEMGYLDVKGRSNELGNSKVTLFPIRWEEPFGLVMVESMACGTPIIAYAQGSSPEIIQDGVTGFLVNVSDQDIRGDYVIKKTGFEGLCEAISKIYNMSSDEYKKMRANSRKHVEKNFTSDTMIDQHVKLYQEIIGGKKKNL